MCDDCKNIEEFIKDCGGTYFQETEFRIYLFKCAEMKKNFIVLLPASLSKEQDEIIKNTYLKKLQLLPIRFPGLMEAFR